MANINARGLQQQTYDAIVIGSGMSGGWAAKELCEKGLKTLVLERGRMVRNGDYPSAEKDPWDFAHRDALTAEQRLRQHKQIRSGFVGENESHFFVDDLKHSYQETRRFDWIRGCQTGGRSLLLGYFTQAEIGRDVLYYKPVPGEQIGCRDLESGEKITVL